MNFSELVIFCIESWEEHGKYIKTDSSRKGCRNECNCNESKSTYIQRIPDHDPF